MKQYIAVIVFFSVMFLVAMKTNGDLGITFASGLVMIVMYIFRHDLKPDHHEKSNTVKWRK